MRIRCLTGVLGRVALLTAVSTVATAAVAGQVTRLPGSPAVRAVSGGGSAESMAVDSVAVVPFTNISRNERDDWLGHGIAETVAADLETRDAFTVVALERVAAAMGGVAANRDDTAAAALGRELGSRWVVAGGYQRSGDRPRITRGSSTTLSGTLPPPRGVDAPSPTSSTSDRNCRRADPRAAVGGVGRRSGPRRPGGGAARRSARAADSAGRARGRPCPDRPRQRGRRGFVPRRAGGPERSATARGLPPAAGARARAFGTARAHSTSSAPSGA